MPDNPGELFQGQYRVDSTRLRSWDYAATGWYFITVCTANRHCSFGEVLNHEVRLSGIGEVAHQCWTEIPDHFHRVQLDMFVVMPNHVHGIVVLNLPDDVETRYTASLQEGKPNTFGPLTPGSLQAVINTYKGAVTRWCGKNSYHGFHWQDRFHDHIIRGERTLNAIRQYIANNPLKWEFDRYNPQNPRACRGRIA